MINSILPVYNKVPLELSHGEGTYLYTTDNTKYLDFVSGIAVNALGHCHPKLVEALNTQSKKLWHTSNVFNIPGMQELANKLTKHSFADTVFFTNSGAEANECMFKMIRKYHHYKNNHGRYKIITFTGAFHGRTLATTWASKREPKMQEGFAPEVDGFVNVEFNNLQAVEDAIDNQTAAILVEPIQGEGGIRLIDPHFFEGLRKLCNKEGLLLCLDEIQCGIGRTGRLYAYQHEEVEPDILSSAKGIGGGFPLGACLTTEKVAEAMNPGSHGSTYGGNPLAIAVGNAVLDEILSPGFLDQVREREKQLKNKLVGVAMSHSNILKEVRGKGLMLGLKLTVEAPDFIARLRDHGMLAVGAAENVVRLLPPLNVSEAEIDEAAEKISLACKDM